MENVVRIYGKYGLVEEEPVDGTDEHICGAAGFGQSINDACLRCEKVSEAFDRARLRLDVAEEVERIDRGGASG